MDKTKSMKSEEVEKEVIKVEEVYSHRYFCDACTGIAGKFKELDKMPHNIKCLVCGRVQKFKQENLIKL